MARLRWEVTPGLGPFGTLDMAGNVREWCWNQAGDHHWILGGSWGDPEYMFTVPYHLPPLDRSAANGFRLASYEPVDAELENEVSVLARDYTGVEPITDAVFEAYARLFSYAPSPLDVRVDAVDESAEDWTRETISFAAAYGGERVTVNLWLPRRGTPPFQVIVYFPGLGAFANERSSADLAPGNRDFILRSGRALAWPIYDGSYERFDGFLSLS